MLTATNKNYLSGNNLTGSIPPSIGNCSLLKALDLKNNDLSGAIPETLSQLNLLQTLHLSNNNLSGETPSSLHNLSSLETLDPGSNRLTGNIPPWIGDGFTDLRILRLRSNAFSGGIHSGLSNLRSLQILDLADNNLNGTVHGFGGFLYGMHRIHYYEETLVVNTQGRFQKFTRTLSLLTCIDLSGNSLRGEFPEEMTKSVGIEVLNSSGNHIFSYIAGGISELHQLLSRTTTSWVQSLQACLRWHFRGILISQTTISRVKFLAIIACLLLMRNCRGEGVTSTGGVDKNINSRL